MIIAARSKDASGRQPGSTDISKALCMYKHEMQPANDSTEKQKLYLKLCNFGEKIFK